ncbi:MAG: peroxiredoxin family protein [Planctomycetota bacterium]
MKIPFFVVACLLSTPVYVAAQGDAPAAEQQDPQAAYKKLAMDFQKAMNAWQEDLMAKHEKAEAAGEKLPRSAYTAPTKEFIGTAQELAQEFAGKDEAIPFLSFILKNASRERNAVKWAVKTLKSDHAESTAIGDVVDYLPGAMRLARKDAPKLLDMLAESHADMGVRSKALLARGRMLSESDVTRAIADLEKVQTITKDTDMVDEAKSLIAELKQFAIGAVAPDIDGVDVDGVAFKLSDYRGKVVLLDFWGFW